MSAEFDEDALAAALRAPQIAKLLTRIGEHVRDARKQKGLTRLKLARAAGLSESTIKSVELGRHVLTADTAKRLMAVLPLPLVALFGEEEAAPPAPPPLPSAELIAHAERLEQTAAWLRTLAGPLSVEDAHG